jgi:CheY-like chemotaxis protein
LLETEGLTNISEAEDGETAIEIIHKEHPAIVILDYMMPRMDGQAVARVARLLSPPSKVIVFTGFLPTRPDWTDSCEAYVEKTDIEGLLKAVARQILVLQRENLDRTGSELPS